MSQPAENPPEDIVPGLSNDHRKARKAKRVSLFQFRKKRRKGVSNNPPPPPFPVGCFGNIRGRGRGGGGGGGEGCLYCCSKPNPSLSSSSSPIEPKTSSDPNSPNFTFELLRALVEKNDFYSKECNPHLGIPETDDN